jgi:hypothetical protein
MDNYKDKYLKYKKKYLLLKALEQKGGMGYFYNPTSIIGDTAQAFSKGLDTFLTNVSVVGQNTIDKSKKLLKIINVEFSKLQVLIHKLFPEYFYLLDTDDMIKYSDLIKTIETYKELDNKCNYVCSQVYEGYKPGNLSPNPCPYEHKLYEEVPNSGYSSYPNSTHFKHAPLDKDANGQYISRLNQLQKKINNFKETLLSKLIKYKTNEETKNSIMEKLNKELSILGLKNDCSY